MLLRTAPLLATVSLACGGAETLRPAPQPTSAPPVEPLVDADALTPDADVPDQRTDALALALDVLRRFAADAAAIPGPHFPDAVVPVVLNVADRADGVDITGASLPTVRGQAFVLTTQPELQRQANQLQHDVAYLGIKVWFLDGDERSGADAGVSHGFALIAPEDPDRFLMCCCTRLDDYRRVGAGWIVARNGVLACS